MHARPAPKRRPDARPSSRPDLRIVQPRRRIRTGRTAVLGGALFFLIALGLVAFQNMLVTGQGRLDDLHGRIDDATEQHAELELQVATLESPERIVEAATSDLGMVPPPGITYLTPDGLVTVPAPGAATGTDTTGTDTTTPETTAP